MFQAVFFTALSWYASAILFGCVRAGGTFVLLCICLACSPWGEKKILRDIGETRPMEDSEKRRLLPLAKVVSERIGRKTPPEIVLIEAGADNQNAYAIGDNTIVFTTAFLYYQKNNAVMGVMAHEMGHLVAKDPIWLTIAWGAFWPLQLCIHIIGLITGVCFSMIDSEKTGLGEKAQELVLVLFGWTLTRFQLIFCRHSEYRADRFACDIGLANEMLSFLKSYIPPDYKELSFWEIMGSTHPDIAKRRDKIQEWKKELTAK